MIFPLFTSFCVGAWELRREIAKVLEDKKLAILHIVSETPRL